MRRLTPELWMVSTYHEALAANVQLVRTRELDFNLARSSGIVINQVRGYISSSAGTTSGFDSTGGLCQELDVDPDNTDIWGGDLLNDDVEYDTSRVFRQYFARAWDTAAGATGSPGSRDSFDWTSLPLKERPISITALRHNMRAMNNIDGVLHAELYLKYQIVELSLEELGIVNASRR